MNKSVIWIYILVCTASCGSKPVSLDTLKDKLSIHTSQPFLKINPYGNAPLSAEIYLKSSNEPLTITVKGQDNEDSDISYTWNQPDKTVFPILGLYFNHKNTVILSTPSITRTIYINITETIPTYIKSIKITKNLRPLSPERQNFLNFINPVGSMTDLFATDNYGKIRWYLKSSAELHSIQFKEINNDITLSALNADNPEILTYNMLGKMLNKIKSPIAKNSNNNKRFHHDMFYKDNGDIFVLDYFQQDRSDIISEIDSHGKIIQTIQIGDWIRNTINGSKNDNTGLEKLMTETNKDWAQINSLSFDKNTQTLYCTLRSHGILALDYANHKLKWIFVKPNYTLPYSNQESIYNIPVLKPFILHGISGPDHPNCISFLSQNSQLMTIDNSGTTLTKSESGIRMLVFSVDEITKTAHSNWEYRYHDIPDLEYADIISDIDKTPFNSYIGVFGSRNSCSFLEVTNNHSVLFTMEIALNPDFSKETDNDSDIFVYCGDYQPIYPSEAYSID